MRYFPLTVLIGLGCVTTSVARMTPTAYSSRSSETPIPLYSSRSPTCAFTEIAIVRARRETWMTSTAAVVEALQSKARHLGGDALIGLSFGSGDEVRGTVIRFARDDCKQ